MKPAVFEEKLIRALETRSDGTVHASGDWASVNNQPEVRILKLQMEECRLMPLVYPKEYERRFDRGEPMEQLADEILDLVEKTRETRGIPADFFIDFQSIRQGIFCKVVSADRNRGLLERIPHEIHENLAVVYFYELEKTWMEDASILIRSEHLELWGKTEAELRTIAWKNTLSRKKVKFLKLSQVLAEFGLEDTEMLEENPLYVLSNEQNCFGAAAAFYPGLLAKCALQLGSNLILLPSSIHEWLLIPSDQKYARSNAEELRTMVRDINRTEVSEREVLSDEIYYYDVETDRMQII